MQSSHPVIKNALLDYLLRPKRIMFIVNPKAGTNMQKNFKRSLDQHLDHRKFEYGVWMTKKEGHAAELSTKALEEGYEIVVAVGGDGSINEVASALVDTKGVLGIIPAGSGNGLAMHLGYGRDIEEAIKKLNHTEVRTIDCGLMNGRLFINIAGVGFDGLVSNRMKGSPWRGFLPYFLKKKFDLCQALKASTNFLAIAHGLRHDRNTHIHLGFGCHLFWHQGHRTPGTPGALRIFGG